MDLRAAADRLHDDSSPLLLLHLLLVLGALDVLDRLERDRPMRGLVLSLTYPETVQK